MPTTAARRHVLELARQHDVTLHWVDTWQQAEAFAGIREVRVPWIGDGSDYLIALHELGHVIAPGAQALEATGRTDTYTTLALEGMAWAWAAHVVDQDLVDADDWATVAVCLWSHYERVLPAPEFPHEVTCEAVSESEQLAD